MIKIKDLFKNIDHRLINVKAGFEVSGICADSRLLKKKELFVAVKGTVSDGFDYINKALDKGAAAICSVRPNKAIKDARFVIVKDTAKVLPILASRFFDWPSKSLKLIGITGTNGKTTVSHLIYEILKTAGKSPSLLGTINYRIKDKVLQSSNTTPGALQLHSLLSKMRKNRTDYVVMEVSSHALKQSRVFGIDFTTAILTNITGDHLDYHGSMADYIRSKRLLFESLKKNSVAVLNGDNRFYDDFKRFTKGKVISYGIETKADFKATNIELDINGSRFFVNTPKGVINVRTPLIGRYNVYNVLAATAFAFTEEINPSIITEAISHTGFVRGRLESIEAGQLFRVFIDYAHTHDALENVLYELKAMCSGNLVVVFGCGGDRDRIKRSKMGKIASRLADYVILTSDNPRTEDPKVIIDEIESGIRKDFRTYEKIPDRFKAIEKSLHNRDNSDIVVIAGKGHENYQIIGRKKFPFNDKMAVKKVLERYYVQPQ